MNNKINAEFPITVYGNLEQFNDTLSKARCRIFYKGANRNGSFVSDEFASKLIQTIPYAPIKGIYDNMNDDFKDHGTERTMGRIYGVVPENYNFAWEKHIDEDGIEREYACVDVLLYTALYKEAGDIVGKAQSMELYEPSIKGEWIDVDGKQYYAFTEGSFLGLQVLGEDVEPCFEGAAFFELIDKLESALNKMEQYNLNAENGIQGGNIMPTINFRLSDNDKFEILWNSLNPSFNEEGNWTIDAEIMEIYDDYALAYDYVEKSYMRVYYAKNEDDTITISEKKKCYVIDVTEEEKVALENVCKKRNCSYEEIDEAFARIEEINEKVSGFELKIEEQAQSISTLQTENAELLSSKEELNTQFTAAKEELEALKNYKLQKENAEKLCVIDKYNCQLDEEVLTPYRENVSNYTLLELEKELAFQLVQSKPAIFSLQGQTGLIPTDEPTGGLTEVLEKYRK